MCSGFLDFPDDWASCYWLNSVCLGALPHWWDCRGKGLFLRPIGSPLSQVPSTVTVLNVIAEVCASGLGIVGPFIFVGPYLLYSLTDIIGEYLLWRFQHGSRFSTDREASKQRPAHSWDSSAPEGLFGKTDSEEEEKKEEEEQEKEEEGGEYCHGWDWSDETLCGAWIAFCCFLVYWTVACAGFWVGSPLSSSLFWLVIDMDRWLSCSDSDKPKEDFFLFFF